MKNGSVKSPILFNMDNPDEYYQYKRFAIYHKKFLVRPEMKNVDISSHVAKIKNYLKDIYGDNLVVFLISYKILNPLHKDCFICFKIYTNVCDDKYFAYRLVELWNKYNKKEKFAFTSEPEK